jgi:long-chain acyl-CoA synthetase
VSLVAALSTGMVVCFGDAGATFLTDMQQVQPTFVLGIPVVFEQIHTTVIRRMQDASFLKRKTYSFWMARGSRLGEARRAGRAGIVGRVLHGVGWLVLYRPLRLKLGLLRTRSALCLPATDDPAVLDFFWALGVPVRVGRGSVDRADSLVPLNPAEARA